jgi:aromatic-L-amino-acid decarboxylase
VAREIRTRPRPVRSAGEHPDVKAGESVREQILRLERAGRPLEPGATRRRQLRNVVNGSAERFLRGIESIGAFVESEDAGRRLLDTPITAHGLPIARAIEVLERDVIRPGGHPASAGYLAYIPGGGIYHGALGDYLAAVSNKYAGVFFAGPGAVRMENMLIRWTADLVGYPAGAGGNIASGGSIANLAAIVTARDAHGLRAADFARAVVYLTAHTHHSVDKALRIAGLGDAVVRRIGLDDRQRMRTDALATAVSADRAQGLRPWLIIAAAGSTDTGSVDPLDAIADIALREQCWFHVDAAYGGFFLLTDHGRTMMRGIELVRDAAALAFAHRYSASYMQDAVQDPAEVSPADVSPELTKHFRALRMWLPLVVLGTKPFQAALDEKLLLARYFRDEIRRAGFETGPEPDLSVVTFRRAPRGAAAGAADVLNQRILDGVRRDGRVFLSSTLLDGRFTLRLAVLAFRTHLRTIDMTIRILREQVAALDQPS